MRTERNPFRGLVDWRVSQLIDACGSGRKGLESGFPMQIRSVPPSSLRGIAAAAALAPSRIVYISCNPTTQVRDLRLFAERGYLPQFVQPVDMFPHTPHVESVVLMTKE